MAARCGRHRWPSEGDYEVGVELPVDDVFAVGKRRFVADTGDDVVIDPIARPAGGGDHGPRIGGAEVQKVETFEIAGGAVAIVDGAEPV